MAIALAEFFPQARQNCADEKALRVDVF